MRPLTLFTKKSFSVPTTTPARVPCAIHHIVKGKCLRCPHVVKVVNWDDPALNDSVPTDSEGAE